MQKKSAGSENVIGVGAGTKDGTAKIWGQLLVGLLSNYKNWILRGWLSFFGLVCDVQEGVHNICRFCCIVLEKVYVLVGAV